VSAFATLLAHELRLQYRYGIYAAYGAVVTLYAIALAVLGPAAPDWIVALIIFSDPSALGFFFLGGLMLLEKGEGARVALAITPASARAYLLAKTVALTSLALLAVAVLGLVKAGPVRWELLLPVVALTSAFCIGIGAGFALRFSTVNGYILGTAALLFPLFGPSLLALLEPMPAMLAVIPTVSQFRLILVALGHGSALPVEIAAMFAVQLVAAIAALALGERALLRELGHK
jgi:fluoroquinolone transport system permease protein